MARPIQGGKELSGHKYKKQWYRTFLIEQMHAKMLAGNTVNDKLKFVTPFIKWCYRHRVLDELPRTLDTFFPSSKSPKAAFH